MTLYTRSWQVLCVPLATFGASVAIVKAPVAVTFMFIYFGALGMLLTLGFFDEYWKCSSERRMRLLACGAVVGGGSACSFIGFALLLGPVVFLLAVLVLSSSPYSVRTYRRWLGVVQRTGCWRTLARVCASAQPHYGSRPQVDLSTLTDQQLCQLWRASHVALLNPSVSQMAQTVLERQRYLDEFERRNRGGFAIWLASGPRASANPLPYLVGVPTINWDDLTRGQD